MIKGIMNTGKACAIFDQINDDKFDELQKAEAILRVVTMPTHNGIAKDSMVAVIKYLWEKLYEANPDATAVTKEDEPNENQ